MTSAQDGALNAATYGCGKYVFDMGNCFAAEILSNNCVRVKDGYALNQGRFMGMENGDYEDVVIDNGIKGLKRADLIVMRYSVNSDTGIETAEMMALKGEAGADYTDPDIITGDILAGAVKDDFLLYRVKIDDINLVAVEPLFETSEAIMKLVSEIQKEMPTLKNPEYETPEEPAELVSGENLGTALGKLAAAVKLLLTHKVQQATATILGHVKLSDSAAITEKGVYALDAVEKNASVSGTMANKIDRLNSSLTWKTLESPETKSTQNDAIKSCKRLKIVVGVMGADWTFTPLIFDNDGINDSFTLKQGFTIFVNSLEYGSVHVNFGSGTVKINERDDTSAPSVIIRKIYYCI